MFHQAQLRHRETKMGHLDIGNLVIKLIRQKGLAGRFELQDRHAGRYSVGVGG